jgi:peptidoglycan/LPS O-acetylase OafA/YrhL
MRYCKYIDGLRAMAIMAVVLCHIFPLHLRGGFVGVDIFFVISGYLISSILFRHFETDTFCLYTFYTRRIKRIFPSLITVLIAVLVLGWFVFTSVEYVALSKHTRASVLFISNFVLAKEAGYFDLNSHLKPLLHLWSLSIEEQFYIVWPVLLYYTYKNGINIISLSLALMALSFCFGLKVLNIDATKAFYFPWCRCWELLSGSLLAYFTLNKTKIFHDIAKVLTRWCNVILYRDLTSYHQGTLQDVAAVLGFMINLTSMVLLSSASVFPGWNAVWPVIGSMLIIAAGEDAYINRKILSNKLCVGIGRISYPLYLWHYPLISLWYILEGHNPGQMAGFAILMVSFVFAWLTYRFIEQPIRSSSGSKFTILILVILIGLIGLGAHNIVVNEGCPLRKANWDGMSSLPGDDQNFLGLSIACSAPFGKLEKKELSALNCFSNSSKPRFLVIGDSHALSFSYYAMLSNKLDMAVVELSSHPAFLGYVSYGVDQKKEQRVKELALYNQSIEGLLHSWHSIEYVVLVSRGPVYFTGKGFGIEEQNPNIGDWRLESIIQNAKTVSNQEAFVEGYSNMARWLISKGKKVIFAADFPELGVEPQSCVSRSLSFSKKKASACLLQRSVVDERQRLYRELIMDVQRQVPSILVYDPTSAFCDQDICYGKRDNIIYYGDDDHLNQNGSGVLFEHFKAWLLNQGILLQIYSSGK